jgi:hypothetical protein
MRWSARVILREASLETSLTENEIEDILGRIDRNAMDHQIASSILSQLSSLVMLSRNKKIGNWVSTAIRNFGGAPKEERANGVDTSVKRAKLEAVKEEDGDDDEGNVKKDKNDDDEDIEDGNNESKEVWSLDQLDADRLLKVSFFHIILL